ncbi:hypothetical protein K8T06_10575, partial [bacterium]|nr:hypothetical protein [bacterium]
STPPTPMPFYYKIGDGSWQIDGTNGDPLHKGWTNDPEQVPPKVYDWHLSDNDPGDPSSIASHCINRGGLQLNPGSTKSTMEVDSGFVDLGRHRRREVPMVEEFSATYEDDEYTLTWTAPDYWPDGSILYQSDIGGYVIIIGKIPEGGSLWNPTLYGNPIYEPATSSQTVITKISKDATHFAIYMYDTTGNESQWEWVEIPPK